MTEEEKIPAEVSSDRKPWNRLYFIILGFNALLIILFYVLRITFNHP